MNKAMQALMLSVGLGAGLPAVSAQTLTIEYRDKPPYSYTQNGQPAGFLIERTAWLLQQAGITAHFVEMPMRRTLMHLQANQAPLCTPGFYKLPERTRYSRYSLPIFRDRPNLVLAHERAAARIRTHARLDALFADPELTPGVLDGASYGAQLDRALARTARPAGHAQRSPLQLAQMVAARRVDYMLIDAEDLGWLKRDPGFDGMGLAAIAFADMPPGELRYLSCSLQVSPALMERINRAIRSLPPESHTP